MDRYIYLDFRTKNLLPIYVQVEINHNHEIARILRTISNEMLFKTINRIILRPRCDR